MTKEQVDALIAMGPIVVAATTTTTVLCVGIIQFFKKQTDAKKIEADLEAVKIKETSVGATKIDEIMKGMNKLEAAFERMRENYDEKYETYENQLSRLHDDYKDMIDRIINWTKK